VLFYQNNGDDTPQKYVFEYFTLEYLKISLHLLG